MDNNSELHIVNEVGVFGNLNINDPTKKKMNKNKQHLDLDSDEMKALIEQSIEHNRNI